MVDEDFGIGFRGKRLVLIGYEGNFGVIFFKSL